MAKEVFKIFNNPFLIGINEFYNDVCKFHDDITKNIPNYPPFNISKKDDNKYVIELAVAGFAKSDIDIELDDGILKISGKTEADNAPNYLYRGIAGRSFLRQFKLADNIEIKNAHVANGLLKIALERIIPEHKKPKKIDISDDEETTKELLTE